MVEAKGLGAGIEQASLSRRIVAGFLDVLVMVIWVPLASVLTGILVGWFYELANSPEIDVNGFELVISIMPIVGAVVLASYEPAWNARMGRTPGKAALGLWVATDDGRQVPLNTSFARGLMKVVSVLPFGLGYWNAKFDSRRKTWHDHFLGTAVTTSPPIEEPPIEDDVVTAPRSVPAAMVDPAHPLRRLAARSIDVILLICGAFVVLAVGETIGRAGTDLRTGGVLDAYSAAIVFIYGLFLIAVAFYEIGLVATRGQTIGKKFMGVRVIAIDGETPGWPTSALRWTFSIGLFLIPFIGPFIAGLVFLWVAWDRIGQGLHDKIAGTRVVSDEPGIKIEDARNAESRNVERMEALTLEEG
jgi:uncharacterized RDD family membrane protein YckC